jgi:hypothetical protein
VIEGLFGLALAIAVPLGVEVSARLIHRGDPDATERSPRRAPVLLAVVIGLAILALALPRGLAAGLLVVPWLTFAAGRAVGAGWSLVARVAADGLTSTAC